MDNLDKEFLMEMFLDSDSVFNMNRLAISVADVVNENSENITLLTEIIKQEYPPGFRAEDSNSLESSSPRRRKIFYETVVLNYTDDEYYENFNMKKNTVQALITYLKDFIKPDTAMIVPFDKKVHIFLWTITTDASYSDIALQFGLHKSTVSYIFNEIMSLLAEQKCNFITWPSVEEQHITRIKVFNTFKFPNCVGFIDTCHFKVGSKNSKKYKPESVLLQAVCDESLSFINIHVGGIGVTKKSKVFKESQLSRELKNFIELDNHIIGDANYKLRHNLITPFSSEEVLTDEEMKFNEVHWKARSYIGLAFELLKEKFRRVHHINMLSPESVETLLYAACVLHNFILLHEGYPGLKEEPVTCEDTVTIDPDIVKTADEKRQFLCNYINYLDST